MENGTGHQISLLVSQIERSVMEMRLVPVAKVVPKLKRALRDMCRDQKKEAELVVQCADVEADKAWWITCLRPCCTWCAMPWTMA